MKADAVSIPIFRPLHIVGITICELPERFTFINRLGLKNPVFAQESPSHLIVDFTTCHSIDTAALGMLVSVGKYLRSFQRRMILVNIQRGEVERSITICKLDTLFEITDSVTAAIEMLTPQFVHA